MRKVNVNFHFPKTARLAEGTVHYLHEPKTDGCQWTVTIFTPRNHYTCRRRKSPNIAEAKRVLRDCLAEDKKEQESEDTA